MPPSQELVTARASCSFSPVELNKNLNEGSRDPEMRARVAAVIEKDPVFNKSKRAYLSRADKLALGFSLNKRLLELVDENDWSYMEFLEGLSQLDEPTGEYLHNVAFQPVITSQGSDEQHAEWLPKCFNHEILGCYAQTELGHGSNVQRLETTATYDHATKEFDLHTPSVTATKWWIGFLGVGATHSTVQARLIIKGVDYGPHLFITQIRSLKDHSLMPGVEAGEIGPKVHDGMSSVDNGWAKFTHVKLPLNRMLNRFSQIDEAGNYKRPPHDKLSYGGMIFIRAQMISNLGWSLAKAATISVRYLHCRRQFANPESKKGDADFGIENQVITYPGVYNRVLPALSKALVFIIVGKDMTELYDKMSAQLVDGNTSLLAETHAISSGLKSYVSAQVVESIETVRRACGGHGFMAGAGMGKIYARELPATTYEGDNFILNQQVVRAALKTLKSFSTGEISELAPSSAYLASLSKPFTPLSTAPSNWLNHELILQLISLRAAKQVERVAKLIQSGKSFASLSWECVAIAKGIVESFLVSRMIFAIDNEEGLLRKGLGEKERNVMRDVVHFYVLHTLETALPELLEFGIIIPSQSNSSPIESLRSEVNRLALLVLPNSVGLVDSFGYSDYDLDSTIGRFDGNPYVAMYEKVIQDRNENTGGDLALKRMYEESIKPTLERGIRLSKL